MVSIISYVSGIHRSNSGYESDLFKELYYEID